MAHQPLQEYPFPSPELELAPFQETRSIAHGSICAPSLPFDPWHPEDPPRNPKRRWNLSMGRWIPKPSLAVFFILVAVTGISFCPALLSNSKPFDLIILDGISPATDGVKILGSIFDFDWSDPSKVSVTWSVIGFGNYSLQTANGFPNDMPPPNVALNIYLDDPSNPAFSYDPANLPVQWDGARLPLKNSYSFTMQHNIETGVQYYAPNDRYSFSAFVFAVKSATNQTVPIITFELGSSGPGDFGSTSEVVPTGSQFTYNSGNGSTTVQVYSDTIYASIVRSIPARALTYSMFAINWVLAGCSIITTSVAFNREGKKSDVGITLLPVTVILTIPAIRNLYVGSPPFGIFLDVVGFFPQMLIVASCTVIVLSGYALKSIWGKVASAGEKEAPA